jgi:hypothetical protein
MRTCNPCIDAGVCPDHAFTFAFSENSHCSLQMSLAKSLNWCLNVAQMLQLMCMLH